MTSIAGQRVLVMGLGRFGGGLGVTRWMCGQGAHVVLTDLADAQTLAEPLAALDDLVAGGHVTLRLGGHSERDFVECDLIVANPAVPTPWANPFLDAARRARRPITTEMRLLVEQLGKRPVIGVTGTAGKSTTSAMVAHVLRTLGHGVRFGGNIGGSLLAELDAISRDDIVVVELSSFMLHWLGAAGAADRRDGATAWSPSIAAITNIAPNHLDWHGSFEHYRDSKLAIAANQRPGDALVRGDEPPSAEIAALELRLGVPGEHNRTNARLAVALASLAAGRSPREAAAALESFAGLPHRLELVAEHDGRRFYNDSKSTTPEATLRAVAAFDDAARIHLIAGGYDKGADLSAIASLAARLGGLYTIGATGEAIAAAAGISHAVHVATLDRAVDTALARMRRGDLLLLSPGCASWDQFTNYEARGKAFVERVRALIVAS